MKAWLQEGETLCTSAGCWYELACGPVSAEALSVVEGLFRGGVLPLGRVEALEGARLWNTAGRARALRVDALIAGTALTVDATVAAEKEMPLALRVPNATTIEAMLEARAITEARYADPADRWKALDAGKK